MTELEKIAYAKSFMDKLANGINPIDNSVIPENDVVNNVRLSRCFFYVSDILRQVIDNGGITPPEPAKSKKTKKQPYSLSPEQAMQFEYSDIPITASEIVNRINAVGPQEGVKKFPQRNIVRWLICLGFIDEVEIDGAKVKVPTESGKELGISLEERHGQYGGYYVILYNRDAQQFIIDNIDAMLSFNQEVYRERMQLNNQGKVWGAQEDERLVALFNEGKSIQEIATELQRGSRAVIIRLRRHGVDLEALIED